MVTVAAVVAKANAQMVEAVAAVKANVRMEAVAVAVASAVDAALHATTIAMVNSSLHVNTHHVHLKARAAVVVPVWDNPLALPMSHGLIAHQQGNLTPCAPAWI